MPTIDLDAQRAARAELEPKTVRFAGHTFTLPQVLPLAVQFAPDDMQAALAEPDEEKMGVAALKVAQRVARALLGDQYERFLELGATGDDIIALVEALADLYGVDVGESSASSDSSPNDGSRSRPTSPATTDSTSPKSSTGPARSARAASKS